MDVPPLNHCLLIYFYYYFLFSKFIEFSRTSCLTRGARLAKSIGLIIPHGLWVSSHVGRASFSVCLGYVTECLDREGLWRRRTGTRRARGHWRRDRWHLGFALLFRGRVRPFPFFWQLFVSLVVCLASNGFPADFVSVSRMKKSNNKNHKKFFRGPETPASLPWRRETTKHKINMAENVLVGVIVKAKPKMANRIHCRNFCATKCCYSVHFQIRSVGRRLTVKKGLWPKQDKKV